MSETLFHKIRDACARGHVIDLGEALLQVCRACKSCFSYTQGDPREALRRMVEDTAQRYFESALGERELLEQDDGEELIELIQGCWSRGPNMTADHRVAMAARACAEALQEVAGPQFINAFHQHGPRQRARANEAVPVACPPVREIFGTPNARPENLAPQIDRLKSLRLVPQDTFFEVRVVIDSSRSLRTLVRGSRLGVGLPMTSIQELQWDTDAATGTFWNVRPRDPGRNYTTIQEILESAYANDIEVLVLPELCLTQDDVAMLGEQMKRETRGPGVLVAGSFHSEIAGERANRATLFIGRKILYYDKKNPFILKGLTEDIRTDCRELLLVFSHHWSLTVVICKDLLWHELYRLLSDIGVRLVLVPACSPRLTDFAAPVQEIAMQSQGSVLIANTTDKPGEHVLMFSQPLRRDRVQTVSRSQAASSTLQSVQLGGPDHH